MATKIGEMKIGNLTVNIEKLTGDRQYQGPVVSFSGLPAGMGDEFYKWMTGSAVPSPDHAYLHDFNGWLRSKGLKGEVLWMD